MDINWIHCPPSKDVYINKIIIKHNEGSGAQYCRLRYNHSSLLGDGDPTGLVNQWKIQENEIKVIDYDGKLKLSDNGSSEGWTYWFEFYGASTDATFEGEIECIFKIL